MSGKPVVFLGNCDIDEYYSCDRWPHLGDKAVVRFLESKVGGMIANAASIYASYGAEACLMTVLGTDSYTPVILDDLRQYGVRTDFLDIAPDCPNGKTHIMLSGNERTIFIVANPGKPALRIDERKRKLLQNASYLYTTIAELKKLPAPDQLIGTIRQSGCKLALDVESESFADRDADAVYFRAADVLFMNEFAFEKYSRGLSRRQAFARLLDAENKIAAVTLGPAGCLVRTLDSEHRIEGWKVGAVDPTGAGDMFNATFLYGLGQGWEVRRAAETANAAAARSTMFLGPKAGIAPMAEIAGFIDRGKGSRS